ncbi:MAG: hypothetical protein Q4G46_11245, partial [Propionibacteriaceae bacterium]|nr:hypothetical protein [Propionibacteriaceae bacterium]
SWRVLSSRPELRRSGSAAIVQLNVLTARGDYSVGLVDGTSFEMTIGGDGDRIWAAGVPIAGGWLARVEVLHVMTVSRRTDQPELILGGEGLAVGRPVFLDVVAESGHVESVRLPEVASIRRALP